MIKTGLLIVSAVAALVCLDLPVEFSDRELPAAGLKPPRRTLQAVRSKPSVSMPRRQRPPVRSIASIDPVASALTALNANGDSVDASTQARNAEQAGLLLADRSPKEISSAVSQVRHFRSRRLLMAEIVKSRLDSGRTDLRWIHDIVDAKGIRFAYETMGRHWAGTDPAAAWTWLEGIDSPARQQAAVAGLAWTLAQQDFAATAAWIAGQEQSTLRDTAALKTVKILAGRNPQAAVEWAAKFPPGSLQDDAITYGLHQWTGESLDQAVRWANSLTNASIQSHSITQIAAAWANYEPKATTIWVASFPEELREDPLEASLLRWQAKDPQAAKAWLASQASLTVAN